MVKQTLGSKCHRRWDGRSYMQSRRRRGVIRKVGTVHTRVPACPCPVQASRGAREAATGSPRGLARLCFWPAVVGRSITGTICCDVYDACYMPCAR